MTLLSCYLSFILVILLLFYLFFSLSMALYWPTVKYGGGTVMVLDYFATSRSGRLNVINGTKKTNKIN